MCISVQVNTDMVWLCAEVRDKRIPREIENLEIGSWKLGVQR